MPKSLRYIKKQYLCTALEQCTGLWCNGNTADSGPAFPGSSPGSPAHKRRDAMRLFSIFVSWATRTRTRKDRTGGMRHAPSFLFLICSAARLRRRRLACPRNGAASGRSRSGSRSPQYVCTCVKLYYFLEW